MGEPKATSTPALIPRVGGRKSIRDRTDSIQSPINGEQEHHFYESMPNKSPSTSPCSSPTSRRRERNSLPHSSEDSEEDEEYCVLSQEKHSDLHRIPERNVYSSESDSFDASHTHSLHRFKEDHLHNTVSYVNTLYFGVFLILLVTVYGLYVKSQLVDKQSDLNKAIAEAQDRFKQNEDFWQSIKVNIQDIPAFHRPKTILFVYEENAENVMTDILREVSNMSLCYLTHCFNQPVNLDGASLSRPEIIEDYGKIIADNHGGLRDSGVMIVKNIERVPGIAAQAFHSICDEYSPLEKNAIILLTMKVESLPREQDSIMNFVENNLLRLWKDLSRDDKFYPLFSRITSTVLIVHHE